MTRLKEQDIDYISARIKAYDEMFKKQTGCTMEELAKQVTALNSYRGGAKVAVVPVTSGLGIIGGFSETVCNILSYVGAEAYVTSGTDVAGLQEAYERKADIVFMADDDVCSAFTLGKKAYSDNGEATGKIFAAALASAIGEVEGEEVLIMGAGPVGQAAARYLWQKGAIPVICDLDEAKARKLAEEEDLVGSYIEAYPPKLSSYAYIVDATTAGDYITASDVTEKTIIAAPGMPLGVTKEASEIATVIHNPLEIGIIMMYFDCVQKSGVYAKRNGGMTYGRYQYNRSKKGTSKALYL